MTSTLAAQQKVSLTAYDCAAGRAAVYAFTGCESFDYLAADMVRGGRVSITLGRSDDAEREALMLAASLGSSGQLNGTWHLVTMR